VDQQSIEELFERNADMRLLEFRHNEPGKGASPNKRTTSSFGAESIVTRPPDAVIDDAPRLRVAVAAAPKAGVIPGAVIGIAVDVFNDGTAPAPESKLQMSIPVETEFRAGSLRIDGREPQAPEQLFAGGLPIARLPGATSSKVTFQLGVLPGVNTLYLQPRLQTNGVPVVGTPGITIKRGTPATPAGVEAPRPFYELEPEEEAEELAASPSAEPILPPVVLERPEPVPVPAPPAAVPPDAAAPAAALPVAEPAVAVTPPAVPAASAPAPAPAIAQPEPVAEPAPAAEPEPAVAEVAAPPASLPLFAPPAAAKKTAPKASPLRTAAPAPGRMVRYRTLSNNDVALLDRLFTPDVPGIIAHYVMISSIACAEIGEGPESGGYPAFLRRDIELLGRALVHSRMGKTPQYRIVQSDLDGLALPWSQPTPPQAFPPPRRLRRDLLKTEWQAIGALIQPSERDATLRTRIALLTLAGSTFDGVDRRGTEDCESALAAYRSSALAWLVPLCVASVGADSFVIPAPPATVDAAGRRLVGALKTALTS
jgi:hypothetical protein